MDKEKFWRSGWFYFGIIILIVAGYWYVNSSGPGQYDNFAKCLTEKGVKMYGTNWCHYCKAQKKMFGKSFKYVDFVNCDSHRSECLAAGVKGYPTWKINGENHPGVQPLERLAELGECNLSKG